MLARLDSIIDRSAGLASLGAPRLAGQTIFEQRSGAKGDKNPVPKPQEIEIFHLRIEIADNHHVTAKLFPGKTFLLDQNPPQGIPARNLTILPLNLSSMILPCLDRLFK